jgi:hypothetical protein
MSDAKPPPSPGERSALALEGIRAAGERIAAALERHSPAPAPAVDLDHPKHGDPTVPFDPRSWKGPGFKGRPFSQCPADYLEALGKALAEMGANEPDAVKRKWKAVDAARARGWAERIRSGWKPPSRGGSPPPLGTPPGATRTSPNPAPPPLARPPSYVAPPLGSLGGKDDLPDLD